MCWMHVKKATKSWVEKHARFASLTERRAFWKRVVEPEYDKIHRSLSRLDFEARCRAVVSHWSNVGADKATLWCDGEGKAHDISIYSRDQWFDKPWCFPHRRVLPATDNVSESVINRMRNDHGRIPLGPQDMTAWLLQQVTFTSKLQWDPDKTRPRTKAQWSRAHAFSKVIATNAVRQLRHAGQIYFVCHGRQEGASGESDRPAISETEGRST